MGNVSPYRVKGIFPNSLDFDYSLLCFPMSVDEIRATLFYMKSWKALGLNGFHVDFFQSQ